jgi:hypothetical protein
VRPRSALVLARADTSQRLPARPIGALLSCCDHVVGRVSYTWVLSVRCAVSDDCRCGCPLAPGNDMSIRLRPLHLLPMHSLSIRTVSQSVSQSGFTSVR